MIRESSYRFRVQTGASLIAHFVVAISAAHGANAMIVRAANEPRSMDSPRVSLQRRIQLVAVETTRVLEDRCNLSRRSELNSTAGLVRFAASCGRQGPD
jgi:hypothetical protein